MDILEIKNVAYSYANSKEKVLSGVNQKFELGKFYAIVGKSGTGKSTLLSLLAGLDKPQTGMFVMYSVIGFLSVPETSGHEKRAKPPEWEMFCPNVNI